MKSKVTKKIGDVAVRVTVALEDMRFKRRAAIIAGAIALFGVSAPGYCDLDTGINKLITAGLGLLQAVGIILAAIGVGQSIMQILSGLRGEGEMQMSKIATGVGFVAAGIVLFSLKTILKTIGISSTTVSTGL